MGSLLLMHIEGLARAQGIANIISIITGSSERSCAFHEKNGFVLEGVRFYRKKYNVKSIGLPKLFWRPDFFIFFLNNGTLSLKITVHVTVDLYNEGVI